MGRPAETVRRASITFPPFLLLFVEMGKEPLPMPHIAGA